MKLIKFLIAATVLSLTFASCTQKDYTCVCADDFCPTPWVQAEIQDKTKNQAKAECDTHDYTSPETGITRNCEIE
jgi:molybdate-binding protein